MSHHDGGDSEFPDSGLDEVLPGHFHHASVEVQKDGRVNAVDAADDLLPLRGAVDQGNFFSEYEGIGVYVKGKHRGSRVQFRRAFLHALKQGRMSAVYTVKKAERDRSAYFTHVVQTSKKDLIVRQRPRSTRARARNAPVSE